MTLRIGSKGSAVKVLQSCIGVTADGIFGKATEKAVREFQKSNGLIVDGIVGAKTWDALGNPELPGRVVIQCEDLKQFSAPHGNMTYGPNKSYSTYANGGCGVTSLAVVQRAYGLAPDNESSTKTIQRLGEYAWNHGYRIQDGGTRAGLFNTNGTKSDSTSSSMKIESSIREGKLVILLIKAGFPNGYGGKGHYIVAYGIDGDYVLLRDVGSSKASRQKALLSKITKGLKQAYVISKR